MKNLLKKSGFTLIELIIVVAIISLLAAATFVAVNPAKRVHEANDAQRWADINAIADAWGAYAADNSGSVATSSGCISDNINCMIATKGGVTSTAANNSGCASTTVNGTIWLDPLVSNGFLGDIPYDPASTGGTATNTGYYFHKDANGAVFVGACEKDYDGNRIELVR